MKKALPCIQLLLTAKANITHFALEREEKNPKILKMLRYTARD
jgi:hypothetical protein